jgi:hypothetical protein
MPPPNAKFAVSNRGWSLPGRNVALFAAALLGASAAACSAEHDVESKAEIARSTAADFGITLAGELQRAIASGGPANAIAVCNIAAPAVAAGKSSEHGMDIGRTSLKLRQPTNEPDGWETAQLLDFERRRAAGEDPATIEAGEYVLQGGRRVFRFMKAIPTSKICLNCHGANLTAEVRSKLNALYPEDAAVGFAAGDLRGAFTITMAP